METTTDELTTIPKTATLPTLSTNEPPTPAESEPEEDEPHTRRTRKPSRRVCEILSGHAMNSSRPSDPLVAPGVQVPTDIAEETPKLLMDVDLVEYALVAEMSEVEGLEPQSLAEVK